MFSEHFPCISMASLMETIIDNDQPRLTVTLPDGRPFSGPAAWGEQALQIAARLYVRKEGIPNHVSIVREEGIPERLSRRVPADDTEYTYETSIEMILLRLTSAWAYYGLRYGLIAYDKAVHFQQQLYDDMLHQRVAPNSPQWFNTGLWWAYGITEGSKGYWMIPPGESTPIPAPNGYEAPLAHACFIQSIHDDLLNEGGIMDLWMREARVFKQGAGSGTNFSNLREEGALLSSGGRSSGVLSFLGIGDRAAGAIKSGGATRRAAKMVILDDDHPDIEAFINLKAREEEKVEALVEGSKNLRPALIPLGELDYDYRNEAYQTVTGQNANNSVRVTDLFMKRALGGASYTLRSRGKNGGTIQKDAKSLLRAMANAAWQCADPGIQYKDTINKWNTCKADGEINASNPCSEYFFLDDTGCNLASINLAKFLSVVSVNDEVIDYSFDTKNYIETIQRWTRVLDITVSMGQYPTEKIARRSHDYRTLGLGYANLSGLLLMAGIPYASASGRYLAQTLTAILTGVAYDTSIDMAREYGAFPRFDENRESFAEVMHLHFDHAKQLAEERENTDSANSFKKAWTDDRTRKLADLAVRIWGSVTRHIDDGSGARNAQVSVLAPTGTIGLVMNCSGTGMEPIYALETTKFLAGGGTMKIVPDVVAKARELFSHLNEEEQRRLFATAMEIEPMHHLLMVAALQPFLSGGISKTINVPEETTPSDIEQLYITGWQLGCKALSVYRENSKKTQVLSASSTKAATPKEQPSSASALPVLPALPTKRTGYTQKVHIGNHTMYHHTGEYPDGRLAECFASFDKEGSTLAGALNAFCIALSIGLQHGIPLERYVESLTFTGFAPNGPVSGHEQIKSCTSIIDYLMRDLGISYCKRNDLAHVQLSTAPPENKEPEKPMHFTHATGSICPTCQTATMIRSGTCEVCTTCGMTSGCS